MAGTSLRRLLDLFQNSRGALSIPDLAAELGVTPARTESMVEFWIRKGKIRIVDSQSKCGSCGIKGDCPMVFAQPQIYELVDSDSQPEKQKNQAPCSC